MRKSTKGHTYTPEQLEFIAVKRRAPYVLHATGRVTTMDPPPPPPERVPLDELVRRCGLRLVDGRVVQ